MATRTKIFEIAETIDYVCNGLEGKVRPELARLLFGTAAKESDFEHTVQIGGGPALGYWQIEPDTAMDIKKNWLVRKPGLQQRAESVFDGFNKVFCDSYILKSKLEVNITFACIVARFQYQRDPDPIPKGLGDRAMYWKRVHNTMSGEGTAEEYVAAWHRHKCEAWCEIMGWEYE